LNLPLQVALLKGRGSYLCLQRLEQSRQGHEAADRTLAHALAKTVVRDYDAALALTERVLQDKHWKHLHGEAAAFRQLAEQLKAGVEVQPLRIDGVSA
jgi:Rad3-related DNA helicase